MVDPEPPHPPKPRDARRLMTIVLILAVGIIATIFIGLNLSHYSELQGEKSGAPQTNQAVPAGS
jgi:hypothetical protein